MARTLVVVPTKLHATSMMVIAITIRNAPVIWSVATTIVPGEELMTVV
jgi:hypothetical protein